MIELLLFAAMGVLALGHMACSLYVVAWRSGCLSWLDRPLSLDYRRDRLGLYGFDSRGFTYLGAVSLLGCGSLVKSALAEEVERKRRAIGGRDDDE